MTDPPVTKKKPMLIARVERLEHEVAELKKHGQWRAFAKKHWVPILLACAIALQFIVPFFQGSAPSPLPTPNPLVQKLDINGIVSQSPNDKAERRIIATEYRKVADSIKNGTITEKSKAEIAIGNQAQNVWLSKNWITTYHNLKKAADPINDLESFADKLYEIADAFERASK